MVEVGEHYRATAASDSSAGTTDDSVYRVVGATEEVTLLRVTDADGQRANTGEIRRVAPETLDADFERADDPDAGFTPVSTLRNQVSGVYWSVRRFF